MPELVMCRGDWRIVRLNGRNAPSVVERLDGEDAMGEKRWLRVEELSDHWLSEFLGQVSEEIRTRHQAALEVTRMLERERKKEADGGR